MDKKELLEKLYMVKYHSERQHDYNIAEQEKKALDEFVKKHPVASLLIKRDIDRKKQRYADHQWLLEGVIDKLDKEAAGIEDLLPLMLRTESTYLDAAIDDLIMGRADNVEELIALFEKRQEMRMNSRKDWGK